MLALATMPLEKLPLASIDLETTELNPKNARIVQVGMADPHDEKNCLDKLVNPNIPIPPKSTAIHHINDDMIKDAENIAHTLPRLREKIGTRVILGYNIGFDLAVLEAEAARHGLKWEWNMALCVRQLAIVALGNESMMMLGELGTLAEYYSIPADNRHTALGDAIITAKIFNAMLPDLEKKSVTTLGDALRSISNLDEIRQSVVKAGWIDIAASLQHPPVAKPLERIDSYPYRHRISELMLPDPIILPPETSTQEAAVAMKERKADCVFIGSAPDSIEGIVSELDLLHAIALPIETVERARSIPIGDIMSSPVITIHEDDFMHVALGRINRLDIRHLGVENSDGHLVGWISTRELIRQRVTSALVIGDQIAMATKAKEIQAALKQLPRLSVALLDENVDGHLIAAVISSEYRAALKRAAVLAEEMMQKAKKGEPPCPYAVLVLGSAGRGESLLAADQDHAIIYSDADKTHQEWFEALGGHIADILDEAGIPYCQGKVMSNNPVWCKSLKDWQKTIAAWVKSARPEDVLSVDIFFDFWAVHGAMELGVELNRITTRASIRAPDFLKLLASSVANSGGGTTLFGGLKTENGRFDIKKYLLLPLVETLRVLAISRGISRKSSARRAEDLRLSNSVPPEVPVLAEDIHFCLRLVLEQQLSDISQGLPPTTKIALEKLNPNDLKLLKSIKARVSRLDTILQDCLFD